MAHLTIGKFGRLTGLTAKALRLYASEGLLMPEAVNPATGYRYYSQAQAQVAERIRLLRSVDLPLADIRTILRDEDSRASQRLLQAHRQRIEAQLGSYQNALLALEDLSARDVSGYAVAVKEVPQQPILYTRQSTSIPQTEIMRARAFGELYGFLRQHNLAPTGPGFTTNAREGQFEPQQEIDLEAVWWIDVCVPVAEVMENRYIGSRVFPGGRVAYVLHVGPYQPLFQVYQKIAGWVRAQGLVHSGRTREIYFLGPTGNTRGHDLRTEVQFYLA